MFDFLSEASTEQATAGIYYATRLIRHANYVEGGRDRLRVKDLESEPSSGDALLAERIIFEIETTEQSSLARLDKFKADEYIKKLADTLQTLLKTNLKYDEVRGEELLGKLRKDERHPFAKRLYQGVQYLSDFSNTRWLSYTSLLASLLTFLCGVTFAEIINQKNHNKFPTMIEGFVAVLNVALAFYVLLDLQILRPVKTSDENSPASNSFKQLLRGWQLLWLTWIPFYICLAVIWFQPMGKEKLNIMWGITDGLNMINGFFFYFLFFVLDQPSVATVTEPDRAKSFRRNWRITLFLGVILWLFSLFSGYAGGNEGLWSKLVPAYIAVGMAFFVGRLDSHYLKLPRVILAPLYLYAIIQLFWGRDISDVSKFNGERVVIFIVALILKFVVFLTLSKLIRHESFRRYFVVAEKGLSDT
jgi:hypothetical protein